MSIIDETYYKGDIILIDDQLSALFQDSDSDWQNVYEDDIIQKLLGYPLCKLYKADLALATAGEPTTQRFIDLVDGKEFTFDYAGNTITTKWKGLRDSTLLKSLIAYYVYYQYRNEIENFNSGSGQVHASTENSTQADIRPKLINSWNKMVDLYGKVPNCYTDKNLFLDNGNYTHFNAEPSAYNFLLANLETYPEWVFEPIEKRNIFGI